MLLAAHRSWRGISCVTYSLGREGCSAQTPQEGRARPPKMGNVFVFHASVSRGALARAGRMLLQQLGRGWPSSLGQAPGSQRALGAGILWDQPDQREFRQFAALCQLCSSQAGLQNQGQMFACCVACGFPGMHFSMALYSF